MSNVAHTPRNSSESRAQNNEVERRQVEVLARASLGAEELFLFDSLKHVNRIGVWWNKKIVVYTAKGKRGELPKTPILEGVITVTGGGFDFDSGLSFDIEYHKSTGEIYDLVLDHTPQKIPGVDVFCWIPHYTEIHWVQDKRQDGTDHWKAKAALCFKSKSDWKWFNNMNSFAMELKQFKSVFPAFENHTL